MAEFTGERVIPGLVEDDLWNEHIARYLFASTLAFEKRVLDVGCGVGYGTQALAARAAHATGFDISEEAIDYARGHYGASAEFKIGSATAFPVSDNSFDLVTAFEVIEHLARWQDMLKEASRVLKDEGLLLVSTPNKSYYAHSRREEGPNPFHVHEFEYEDFSVALGAVFPHVRILAQNQTQAMAFSESACLSDTGVHFGDFNAPVSDAQFYLAVCSRRPVPALSFVYVTSTGNMLRDRERHIELLQAELAEAIRDRQQLLDSHWKLERDFEARRQWVGNLEQDIRDMTQQRDLAMARVVELEKDNSLLHEWEQVRMSRWLAVGRKLGLGPRLPDRKR